MPSYLGDRDSGNYSDGADGKHTDCVQVPFQATSFYYTHPHGPKTKPGSLRIWSSPLRINSCTFSRRVEVAGGSVERMDRKSLGS